MSKRKREPSSSDSDSDTNSDNSNTSSDSESDSSVEYESDNSGRGKTSTHERRKKKEETSDEEEAPNRRKKAKKVSFKEKEKQLKKQKKSEKSVKNKKTAKSKQAAKSMPILEDGPATNIVVEDAGEFLQNFNPEATEILVQEVYAKGTPKITTDPKTPVIQLGHKYRKGSFDFGQFSMNYSQVEWKGQKPYEALVFWRHGMDKNGKPKDWHFQIPISLFQYVWNGMHYINNGQHQPVEFAQE